MFDADEIFDSFDWCKFTTPPSATVTIENNFV